MYFLKIFLLAGIPFGVMFGVLVALPLQDIHAGLKVGVIFGSTFGAILSIITGILRAKIKKENAKEQCAEEIIIEDSANHFKNSESVGGWLRLTKGNLIFKSHSMNIQTHTLVIPLNHIKNVKGTLSLGFIPNGLCVTTTSRDEKFVVFNRKSWINNTKMAMSQQNRP